MSVNPIMEEARKKHLTPEIQKQVDLQVMIANRIYDLLKQRGMTSKELADCLGETEEEVNGWLCGTKNLSVATVAKVACALEDDLITATKNKKHNLFARFKPFNRAAVL